MLVVEGRGTTSLQLYICLKYRGLILFDFHAISSCDFWLYICLKYRGLILLLYLNIQLELLLLYICLKYRGLIQKNDAHGLVFVRLYICLKYRGLILIIRAPYRRPPSGYTSASNTED